VRLVVTQEVTDRRAGDAELDIGIQVRVIGRVDRSRGSVVRSMTASTAGVTSSCRSMIIKTPSLGSSPGHARRADSGPWAVATFRSG
jgi:hypothetical protein